jgi:hypothetical protein
MAQSDEPGGEREEPRAEREAEFVRQIVTDPRNVPDVMRLYGYPGASSEEHHDRLYLNADLSQYVEVPTNAILHRMAVPTEQDPNGAVVLWVRQDAALVYKSAPAAQALAQYFAGAIAGAAAAGAAPGAAAALATQHCTIEPCFTANVACLRSVRICGPSIGCTDGCDPFVAAAGAAAMPADTVGWGCQQPTQGWGCQVGVAAMAAAPPQAAAIGYRTVDWLCFPTPACHFGAGIGQAAAPRAGMIPQAGFAPQPADFCAGMTVYRSGNCPPPHTIHGPACLIASPPYCPGALPALYQASPVGVCGAAAGAPQAWDYTAPRPYCTRYCHVPHM